MPTEIEELREQCKHPFIRERRAAITRLAELMQDPDCRVEAQALLAERAKEDEIQNMRTLAASVLEYFERHDPRPTDADRTHIFAVSCPHCQRIGYYDKREVCRYKVVYRGEPPQGLDELMLKCTHCGKQLKALISCAGYE